MEELKVKAINPVIDDAGKQHDDWVKHIVVDAEDNEVQYNVLQNETGIEYFEPIDLYPCRFTYSVGSKIEEIEEQGE